MKILRVSMLMVGMVLMSFVISPSMAGEEHRHCKADVEKFCSDVKPGGGRITQCLNQHKDELSENCRTRGQLATKGLQDFTQVCEADIATHCGDVKKGRTRILRCLKQHKAELSPACGERMEKEWSR